MIGLGKNQRERDQSHAKPTNHIHGAIAAIARPPSSGTTGSRLNRFRRKPVKASARQMSLPVACQIRMQRGRSDAAEDRPGEADAGFGQRVVAERAGADHGAEEGDEHRRAGLDSLAAQRDHVAHLVDRAAARRSRRRTASPRSRRRRRPRRHRPGRGEKLELGQEQQDRLELGQDRHQRRAGVARACPSPGREAARTGAPAAEARSGSRTPSAGGAGRSRGGQGRRVPALSECP